MGKKARKKKAPAAKLWTIRMPEDLLKELNERAALYNMQMQPFCRYIIRQGLRDEKLSGLEVSFSDREEAQALVRHQRAQELLARKTAQQPPKPSPVPVIPAWEVEAMLGGGSKVFASPTVVRALPAGVDPFLADAGVAPEVPEAPKPESAEETDEDLVKLLASM